MGLPVVKQKEDVKNGQEEREGRSWESKVENRMEHMESSKDGVSKRDVTEGWAGEKCRRKTRNPGNSVGKVKTGVKEPS